MAISETISVDAGPAIGALDELAAAAARADEAMAKLKVPNLGAAGGLGFGKLVAQAEAAAAKIEASFARINAAAKSLGDVGAGGAAGLGKLADAENAAAAGADKLAKSQATVADAFKGAGDATKASSAWLDEYNATMAESAKLQADFAKVSSEANAKIALGQRLNTAAARAASADAVKAQKAQRAAMAESAAAAEASSKKHSTALLGIAAAAGYGIYKAGQLQAGVTRLYTTAGESKANLPMITSAIPKLAGQTATSQAELLQGLYMIESAGFHGKSGLSVLKAAAQGAYAEGAPLGETGNALTSLMNAYGMKPGQSMSAMNQIIAMVSGGKMTMAGAVSALPTLLPAAAGAHLKFSDVGGALGTMTSLGMSPDQAAQNLRHTITSLAKPSNVQSAEMQMLGIDPVKLSHDLGKQGLSGTVAEVDAAVKKHMTSSGMVMLDVMNQSKLATQSARAEISAMPKAIQGAAKAYLSGAISAKQWNAEMKSANVSARDANLLKQFTGTAGTALGFSQMIKSGQGNQQTLTAALTAAMGGQTGAQVAQILGPHMAGFRSRAADIAKAKDVGTSVEGWDQIQKTFNYRLKSFEESMQGALTTVGTAMLPAATQVMKVLGSAGSFLSAHPGVTKGLGIGGGILGAGYLLQRAKAPVTTALQGIGTIGKVLHIPGLDKLTNIGKAGGSAAATSGLDAVGSAAARAATALNAVGAAGDKAAVGEAAAGAAGEKAAIGESAAGAAGAKAGTALSGLMTVAAALLISKPIIDHLENKKNPKVLGNTNPSSPWNSWDSNNSLGGKAVRFFEQSGPASAGPAFTGRFGPIAGAPVRVTVAAPVGEPMGIAAHPAAVQSRGPTLQGIAAHPVIKPKIQPPDTSGIKGALANLGNAIHLKPVKMPAPDMGALNAAKGKAQAAGAGITSAIAQAMHKPVKLPPPDLSAASAAKGKAAGIGAGISAGLAAGIESGKGAVVAAATDVANAAAAAMAHAAQTHSPSKKTIKTGKDVAAGLVVGLQGGKDAVDAAATALGKSATKATDIAAIDAASKKLLGEVPKGDTALTRMLKADTKDLERMARTRSKLEQEISDSEQVAKSAVSGASILNSLNAQNPAGNLPIASSAIVTGQQYQATSLKEFAAALRKDQALGLNATSLSQIAQAGPEQGLGIAQGIASGGKDAVKQLNSIQKQIQASSAQIGNVAGPAMYQAGKDVAKGLAAGLKSELGSLDKAMEHLAKAMTHAVEKHAKTAKHAAHKAVAGTASGAASAAASAVSGASAGGGSTSLTAAAAGLSHAGASLSAAAAALTGAAAALKGDAGAGGHGGGAGGHARVPVHARPVSAGGGHYGTPAISSAPYGGGGHYGTPAWLPYGGGQMAQHVHYHVNQTVHGSVHAQHELIDMVQEGLLNKGISNWMTGIVPPGRAS